MLCIGGPPESPSLHVCSQRVLSHDPGHPVLPASETLRVELRPDTGTPIKPPALLMNCSYAGKQFLILFLTDARLTGPPCIVSAPGHPQHRAHALNGVVRSLFFYELVFHHCRFENAKAFFKIEPVWKN
jgi:hypothetical protein